MNRTLLFIVLSALACTVVYGQRRTSTPVGAPQPGHNYLTDSLPDNEFVDSLAAQQPRAVKNIYPRMYAVEVGVDLWPAVQRALQSHHGLGGIEACLSLYNRYLIALEAGVSQAHYRPEGMNFTYRQNVAPYFKVGIDYNFLYNSDPSYRITALVRYGLSPFAYQYTDVTLDAPYWHETQTIDFPRCHTVSGFVEVGAALQVKLVGPLSAGWSVRYHSIVHHGRQPWGEPWSTPGYGVTSGALGVTLSLTYTIPLTNHHKHNEAEKTIDDIGGGDDVVAGS